MKIQNNNVKSLLVLYRDISLLGKINGLLGWDLNVNLPQGASEGRAEQSAYITKLITQKWQSEEFKSLLERVKSEKNLNNYEKAIVRNIAHGAKYYHRVPEKTIVEFSRATSRAFVAWSKAREKNDFKSFLPHLEKIVDMSVEIAGHLGYDKNPYDALLDLYEPEFTTEKGKKIFSELVAELTPFVKKITSSKTYTSYTSPFKENAEFTFEEQEKFSHFVLSKINYDFDKGRLDISPHPFTENVGADDVRITTRYKKNDFTESIMIALHEGGHALYEQGVNPEFEYTPLEGGVSLGVHESQSRFWENQVGRSFEFVADTFSSLESYFSDRFRENTSPKDFLLHFCRVSPGLIRVEADEVTYNLHIALRFEIEEALINGKAKAKDLPKLWNEKMKKYLGIVPKTDADGVLQDVHWSYGSFGYFPTYTLGNLYAAQFTNAMKKDLDFHQVALNGQYKKLLDWQRKNIHQYGSLYWPDELVKKVTGESLSTKYFLKYLKEKYTKIYDLS